MILKLSQMIDTLSDFFAHRKGLIPMIGILLVIVNFALQLFTQNWLVSTNLFLHLGVILAIFGFMLAWAL